MAGNMERRHCEYFYPTRANEDYTLEGREPYELSDTLVHNTLQRPPEDSRSYPSRWQPTETKDLLIRTGEA